MMRPKDLAQRGRCVGSSERCLVTLPVLPPRPSPRLRPLVPDGPLPRQSDRILPGRSSKTARASAPHSAPVSTPTAIKTRTFLVRASCSQWDTSHRCGEYKAARVRIRPLRGPCSPEHQAQFPSAQLRRGRGVSHPIRTETVHRTSLAARRPARRPRRPSTSLPQRLRRHPNASTRRVRRPRPIAFVISCSCRTVRRRED
ncbi:hypothetical protein C8Q78DRAFT_786405 [Trametes maxima]|nr:hypothetical protein C8Q78DRAFT_786405 [Trametes maxima]